MNLFGVSVYQPGELAPSIIHDLISLTGAEFMAQLKSRVDVDAYASKLHARADSIVARLDGADVGYLAVYATNSESEGAFISHCGVRSDLRGMGVAAGLMNAAESIAVKAHLKFLSLEVDRSNRRATAFYARYGFDWQERHGKMIGTKHVAVDARSCE